MSSSQIADIVSAQRRFFRTGETLPVVWRIQQLKRLKEAVIAHQQEFINALQEDLGRSELEAYHGEWGFREFTHPQTVLKGHTRFNLSLREHPYTGETGKKKMKLLRLFER